MIYIHVPFCRSFCTYCGFYSEICSRDNGIVDRYASALLREIGLRKEEISKHATNGRNTLYIGGGTPSVLPLAVLSSILRSLPQSGWDEFTIEVNPDDIVKGGIAYASGLRNLGVTRISMGIQSFDDAVLRWMNRRHSSADAIKAFHILREAGFDNISIDLIFGFGLIDNAANDNWQASIGTAISLRPEHISAYQLSIEPDSALECQIANGRFHEADEELCRTQYDTLCRTLADAGYTHYEVSNFSLPGLEARHNSGYWDHSPYIGLGPAAHSFDGQRRSWNVSDTEAYIAGASMEHEDLTPAQLAEEDIMLGLRTAHGISEERLRSLCDHDVLETLLKEGSLIHLGDRIRIPEDHFFVSDDIISSLFI